MKTPAELQRQRLLVYIVPSGPCCMFMTKNRFLEIDSQVYKN